MIKLILTQTVNGLELGQIYALIALGYSMVYGIIRLLNFAHGDIIMVGGYIVMYALTSGFGAPLSAALAVVGCTAVASLIYKAAYGPLSAAPRLSLLITAIGVSLLLQNLAQYFFTTSAHAFPVGSMIPSYIFEPGGVKFSLLSIVTVCVSIAAMAGLTLLVQKTKLGKAMRAVSEDTEAAQLMGVNVSNVILFTFAVGAGLAGIGSVLYCCRYPQVTPVMGSLPGLKAFIAAVLGGIGSIPGAMIGGFAIGILEIFVPAVGLSTWTDGVVFAVLIIVLLVKPTGFMGPSMLEKV